MVRLFHACVCVDGQDLLALKSDDIGVFNISSLWNSKRDSWCSLGCFKFLSSCASDKFFQSTVVDPQRPPDPASFGKVRLLRASLLEDLRPLHRMLWDIVLCSKCLKVENSDLSQRISHMLIANVSGISIFTARPTWSQCWKKQTWYFCFFFHFSSGCWCCVNQGSWEIECLVLVVRVGRATIV